MTNTKKLQFPIIPWSFYPSHQLIVDTEVKASEKQLRNVVHEALAIMKNIKRYKRAINSRKRTTFYRKNRKRRRIQCLKTSNNTTKEYVLKKALNYESDVTIIYISKGLVKLHDIKSLCSNGRRVFHLGTNIKGWLIFVNLCNVANWGHMCKYIFISEDKKVQLIEDKYWPPADNIRLEKIQ